MFNNQTVIKIKIKGLPKEREYNALPFGRRLDYAKQIAEFKLEAKTNWISQKRSTSQRAFSQFVKLYDVSEYYAEYLDNGFGRDDSYQIWYK